MNMTRSTRPLDQAPTFRADNSNGPWGDGAGGGGGGGGPRNPWAVPPKGAKPTALDEFLRRARPSGGGGGPLLPHGANPRALWAIGAALLVALWLIGTSFHAIRPEQRGVVTEFGKYARTLDPGVQWTLPAPFARVAKVDVQNIRTDDFPQSGGQNLMLTGDQNIIDLAYSVRWNISSPEDFVFQIKNPVETVRATAESAMREVVANIGLDEALGRGRDRIQAQVQERMQAVLDSYRSGVRIEGVAIKQADPPRDVNEAFKDVSAAQQNAVALRNNAQADAQQKIALAQGEAAAFDKVYAQYKLAPEVTRRRMYYETMEYVLANTDKTIVETPGVSPFLPLDRMKRMPDTPPAVEPAPATGAGR